MSVTKTITTSKPFYVVAGAGDLAVKTLREGTDKLSTLRSERKDIRKDIETTIASLQTETKALPAKAQTVAVTLAADVAGKVGTGYDELLGRGRSVVTRIRRQKSTEELKSQASTTVRRSKATVTTAKKSAAATKKTAKSATTSARKTTTAAKKATKAAASKVGS
jgi:heparin binding hemagglutinin HbhA